MKKFKSELRLVPKKNSPEKAVQPTKDIFRLLELALQTTSPENDVKTMDDELQKLLGDGYKEFYDFDPELREILSRTKQAGVITPDEEMCVYLFFTTARQTDWRQMNLMERIMLEGEFSPAFTNGIRESLKLLGKSQEPILEIFKKIAVFQKGNKK